MSGAADWAEAMAPYARPRLARSLLDIATSVVPYLALTVAMYLTLDVSIWLTLGARDPGRRLPAAHLHRLSRLRARLVLRHQARQPLVRALLRAAGLAAVRELAPRPRRPPRHRRRPRPPRGQGDVPTLTVEEYYSKPWRGRLGYRLFRNPLVMFGIGPIWSLMIGPRLSSRDKRRAAAQQHHPHQRRDRGDGHRRSALLFGWQQFLLVQVAAGLPRRDGRRLAVLRPAPVRGRLLGELGALELRRRRARRAART